MKIQNFRFLLIGLALLAAAGAGIALKPTHRLADQGPKVDLEAIIPQEFGKWHVENTGNIQVVNPQAQAAVDKIYTQVLSRAYVDDNGYRIMLMLPYGANQSDDLAAHDPEGCYPAQGFNILGNRRALLQTAYGPIPVRRMEAENGRRHEPVTYWFTVGNKAVNNGWDRKIAQLSYALHGNIPDGLLFRASSIDPDTEHAYRTQEAFIKDLLTALPPETRLRIAGLNGQVGGNANP